MTLNVLISEQKEKQPLCTQLLGSIDAKEKENGKSYSDFYFIQQTWQEF